MRESVLVMRQQVAEHERTHDARIHQAWWTAALTRGSKDLPKLETLLLNKRKAGSRKQTAIEQVALWQVAAARFGGKFVQVTKTVTPNG